MIRCLSFSARFPAPGNASFVLRLTTVFRQIHTALPPRETAAPRQTFRFSTGRRQLIKPHLLSLYKYRIVRAIFTGREHIFNMTLYQQMLVFYAVMAALTALVTFFLAKDRLNIRLLSAVLVGATWPMSFPIVLMFCLF